MRKRFKMLRRRWLAAFARAAMTLAPRLSHARLQGLASLAALLARVFARTSVQRCHRHLDLAFAKAMGARARGRVIAHMFDNLCRSALETALLPRDLDRWLGNGHIEIDLAPLEALMAEGRAVVVVTPHFGNWEALAAAVGRRFPVMVVARRVYLAELDALIVAHRARLGLSTAYTDESPRVMIEHLRKGGIVGTLPDQDLRHMNGLFVPFFGHLAHTVTGPASLARMSGAALLPMFLARRKSGRLFGFCGTPIEPDPRLSRQAQVAAMTRAWSAQFEWAIARFPANWAWFHRRWRTRPDGAPRTGAPAR